MDNEMLVKSINASKYKAYIAVTGEEVRSSVTF